MALVERWWTSWQPLGQSVTYTLRIKEEGHAPGTTAIENLAKEPLTVRGRGVKEFSIGAISGAEIQFTFWVLPEDGTEYDDLFDSNQRKHLIEIDRAGSLYFIGYMNPANVSRVLIGDRYKVSISASDGLAGLKQASFVDANGDHYTDRVSILTQIKRALTPTDLTIDMNIKLGTWESSSGALMVNTDLAFDKVTVNSRRFYKNEEGVLTPMKCSLVLTELIGIFNCAMRQIDGKWFIYNNVEINSFIFPVTWSTLALGTRTAHDKSIAIDAYDFKGRGSISWRPPLSDLKITFQNKYVPDNIIPNGDFSQGTTDWNAGTGNEAWNTWAVASGRLAADIIASMVYDKTFISDDFAVTEVASTDKFILTLDAIVDQITYSDPVEGEPPFIEAVITNGATFESTTIQLGQMSEGWKTHNHVSEHLLMETGTQYTIKIIVQADNNITSLDVRFDNVFLYVDYGDVAVTVDKLITVHNDNAIDEFAEKHTIRIGDSLELNDQGCLKIGVSLTSEWDTFGNSEGVNLVDLLGAHQLNARQGFVKYLRVVIKDPNDNIHRDTIIIYDSVNYRIIRFKKIYKNLTVSLDLMEIKS